MVPLPHCPLPQHILFHLSHFTEDRPTALSVHSVLQRPLPNSFSVHTNWTLDSPVKKVPVVGNHDGGLGLLDVFKPPLDKMNLNSTSHSVSGLLFLSFQLFPAPPKFTSASGWPCTHHTGEDARASRVQKLLLGGMGAKA